MKTMTTFGYVASALVGDLGARHREVRAIAFTDLRPTGAVRLQRAVPGFVTTTAVAPVGDVSSVRTWSPPV